MLYSNDTIADNYPIDYSIKKQQKYAEPLTVISERLHHKQRLQVQTALSLGRCLWTRDVWPVGYAHYQRHVRATSLLPSCKDGSPSLQSETPAVTHRYPRSANVRLHVENGEGSVPDKYETRTPLDGGGPPVIIRSATPLFTPPVRTRRGTRKTTLEPNGTCEPLTYLLANSRAGHSDMDKLALKIWF